MLFGIAIAEPLVLKTHSQELEGNDSEREMRREEQRQHTREHAVEMQERLAGRVDTHAAAYERQAQQRG